MHEHIQGGGRVKEQDNEPGKDYDIWFAVNLIIGTKKVFVKFVLEPNCPVESGLLIINIHP